MIRGQWLIVGSLMSLCILQVGSADKPNPVRNFREGHFVESSRRVYVRWDKSMDFVDNYEINVSGDFGNESVILANDTTEYGFDNVEFNTSYTFKIMAVANKVSSDAVQLVYQVPEKSNEGLIVIGVMFGIIVVGMLGFAIFWCIISGHCLRMLTFLSAVPWMYIFTKLGLPTSDLATDTWSGFTYYWQGHIYWAIMIWSLMVCPLIGFCLIQCLKCHKNKKMKGHKNKCTEESAEQEETQSYPNRGKIIFLTLIPVFQPFMHVFLGLVLYRHNRQMTDLEKRAVNLMKKIQAEFKPDERENVGNEISNMADELQTLKKRGEEFQALIQEIRMYEIVGESGPQAILQCAIFFRIGFLGGEWHSMPTELIKQVLSIVLSMLSLASGSAEAVLQAPTKRHKTRDNCTWKQVWLLVVPYCLGIIFPRVLTAGLMLAYFQIWSCLHVLLFIGMCYLLSASARRTHVTEFGNTSWRDLLFGAVANIIGQTCRTIEEISPKDLLFSAVTNIFGPCTIIVKEGSDFLMKSTLCGTICHMVSLWFLSLVVITPGINGVWTNKDNNPPITHCFKHENFTGFMGHNITSHQSMARCILNKTEIVKCSTGWINPDSQQQGISIATYCKGISEWSLLIYLACSLAVGHVITVISYAKRLNKVADPTGLLVMSERVLKGRMACLTYWFRKWCSTTCLDHVPPVWNEKYPKFVEPILTLMEMKAYQIDQLTMPKGLATPLDAFDRQKIDFKERKCCSAFIEKLTSNGQQGAEGERISMLEEGTHTRTTVEEDISDRGRMITVETVEEDTIGELLGVAIKNDWNVLCQQIEKTSLRKNLQNLRERNMNDRGSDKVYQLQKCASLKACNAIIVSNLYSCHDSADLWMGFNLPSQQDHLDVVQEIKKRSEHLQLDPFLQGAAKFGHVDIIKTLLERGANSNASGLGRQSALKVAIEKGHLHAILEMMVWGAKVDPDQVAHLQKKRNLGLIPKSELEHMLLRACSKGSLDEDLWSLLKMVDGENQMHIDIQGGDEFNNSHGSTPLMVAWSKGFMGIVRLLIQKGANPNQMDKHGDSLLHLACRNGDLALGEELIQLGVEVDIANGLGETALKLAILEDQADFAQLLIEKGADPNQKDESGDTLLHLVCRNGNFALAEMLMKHGVMLNIQNDSGSSPLMEACSRGHVDIARLLVQKGADPNQKDQNQDSLLHLLCKIGKGYQDILLIAKLLMDNGADTSCKNEQGQTALDMAESDGLADFQKLFSDKTISN